MPIPGQSDKVKVVMRNPIVEEVVGPSYRLLRGDSLDILLRIPAASIDCIVTDPPYGHNNNNGDLIHNREKALGVSGNYDHERMQARPIANDGKEADDVFRKCLPMFDRLLRCGGCCCCCCCGGGPDPQFARWSLWMDQHLEFKQMIVWDKGRIGMGWHYRRSYETVLVAQKRGGPCKWYDTTQTVENIIRASEQKPPGMGGIRKIIPDTNQHPTEKPYQLAEHFLKLHTQEGDTVLDPFMGHGWTGVACVLLNRKYIGIEIDEGFFKTAAWRIANQVLLGKRRP